MAKVKALRKTIIALRRMSKGKTAMPKASKAAAKAAAEVGKKTGLLGRMLPALAGSYIGNKLAGGGDAPAEGSQGTGVGRAGGKRRSFENGDSNDPTIQIPHIEGEELIPFAERTDLTLIEPVTATVSIAPSPIVENYFDDKLTPIIHTAVVHEGTEINAISNSIGALAAATAAAKALDASVKAATDENKRTRRANERRRDERDIEKKKVMTPEGLLGTGLSAGAFALGSFLSKLILPAIAMGFANFAHGLAEDNEGNETPVADILEDEFGWLDDIEEKYTQVAIGLRSLGGAITKGMSQIAVNMIDKFGDWKMARIEKAMAAGPPKPTFSVKLAQTIAEIKKWSPASNPKAMKVFQTINSFMKPFTSLVKGLGTGLARTTAFVATLPKPIMGFFKGLLAKPVRWMAAFYALVAIKDAALTWALGQISEEEFRTRTKANIQEFFRIIGGTWIICTILGLLGSATGTFAVPFFGTLAGGLLGVVIGVLFGETLWQIIGANELVGTFYDWLTTDMSFAEAFSGIGGRIVADGRKALDDIAQQFKDFFLSAGDMMGLVDRVATSEELIEKYGEDAELADIAIQAMDKGLFEDEDENALYAVADQIRDQAHLEQINAQMIEKTDMTLRQWAKSKLSPEEYQEFEGILMRALSGRGGTGIDITDEMKTEYPVVNGRKEVVALFDSRQEADQYIMKNQGSGLDTLYLGRPERTYDPTLAKTEPQTELPQAPPMEETPQLELSEEVSQATLQLNEALHNKSAKDIIKAAVNVRDAGYENVKQNYSEVFNNTVEDELVNAVGEETARSVTRIMSADSREEAMAIAAEEAVSYATENALPMLDVDLNEKMSDVAFVPVFMPAPRGPTEKGVTSGSEAPSLPSSSATPSYSTYDAFTHWKDQT